MYSHYKNILLPPNMKSARRSFMYTFRCVPLDQINKNDNSALETTAHCIAKLYQ